MVRKLECSSRDGRPSRHGFTSVGSGRDVARGSALEREMIGVSDKVNVELNTRSILCNGKVSGV